MKATYFTFALILLGCLFVVHSEYNNVQRIYENEMNETLECIRGVLRTGVPFQFPSFEPLFYADAMINLTGTPNCSSYGYIQMKNLYISGVTKWELKELEIEYNDEIETGATIISKTNFPEIYTTADYRCDFRCYNSERIWGAGRFYIHFYDIFFQLATKILSDKSMEDINILPSIKDFNIELYGLFQNHTANLVIQDMLNDGVVDWVNGNADDIGAALGKFIKEYVNNAASNGLKHFVRILLQNCPLP